MDQNWEMGALPNGARVVTCTVPGSGRVFIEAWLDVGSRNEMAGDEGAAHVVEHTVFKGIEHDGRALGTFELASAMDDLGGRFNAHTGVEATSYEAEVLARHAPQAFAIIGGLIVRPQFPHAEIPKELDVILQEMVAGLDDHDHLSSELLFSTAFPGTPMGRPVIGTDVSVSGFTRDRLAAWREEQYVAHKLVVTVAGEITHAEAMEHAYRHFGGLRQGVGVAPVASHFAGGVALQRAKIEQAYISLAFEGIQAGMPQEPVLDLISIILGDGFTARLPLEIRERRGWAYMTDSTHHCGTDSGLLSLYAEVDPRRAGDSLKIMIDQIANLGHTVTEKELERAKTIMLLGLMDEYEEGASLASTVATGLLALGRVPGFEERQKAYEAVTILDIQQAVERLMEQPYVIAGYGNVRGLEREIERMGGPSLRAM
ncbi:MAG: insulinase family protein [Alphaproteobacteria bacterium]|nr:insulinase family protein [Alphaproteobacteria bacterium]